MVPSCQPHVIDGESTLTWKEFHYILVSNFFLPVLTTVFGQNCATWPKQTHWHIYLSSLHWYRIPSPSLRSSYITLTRLKPHLSREYSQIQPNIIIGCYLICGTSWWLFHFSKVLKRLDNTPWCLKSWWSSQQSSSWFATEYAFWALSSTFKASAKKKAPQGCHNISNFFKLVDLIMVAK